MAGDGRHSDAPRPRRNSTINRDNANGANGGRGLPGDDDGKASPLAVWVEKLGLDKPTLIAMFK